MLEEIRRVIAERKELGYVSVKGFVEDAVRRRLEAIRGGASPPRDLDKYKPRGEGGP